MFPKGKRSGLCGDRRPQVITILLLGLPLAAASAPDQSVTFNKDIAPLIYQNCSTCHRPGEAAPFSLLSYEDVKRKAKTISRVTSSHVMPPWKAEPASYPYRDERRLSEEQIALIGRWVEQGTPEGNPAEKPEPQSFASGWQLGEPNLVVRMPAAFHVPEDGPDIYRNIAVPLGLTEDTWITAIDMKPSARAVVHHVLYFADGSGRVHEKPQQGSEPGYNGMRAGRAFIPLGGWAVGAQPHLYPEGLALLVPKGSDLVVQYHFHPTGKREAEQSVIGLYFAKAPPSRTLTRIQMPPHYSLFSGLDIRAGEKDFVIRDSYALPVAVDAVGVSAHAHYLATRMKMTATLPDGEVKTLLYIKDWDFAWQDRYFFKQFLPLPRGTKLDIEIHWNNSADNPRNPSSPPVPVAWGEGSKDEMGSISLIAVAHQESDLATLRNDLDRRKRQIARERIRSDPALAAKLARILAE
jgi:mono/diheme cytochrome c family protein